MLSYAFHPEAEAELLQAIEYYERQEIGLGYDFAIEIHEAIQNIRSHPHAWKKLTKDIRSCIINRFPYAVIYSQQDEAVFILAIMHCHRNPDYWRKRVG